MTQYTREELEDMADGEVVLNLGCGTNSEGIGVDINYDSDIRANLNEGIPVEDGAVDRIVIEHVIEHLENPSFIFREIRRVLKNSGSAVIEVPNAGWLPVRLWITQDIQKFWEHKNPEKNGHWLARKLGNTDPDRTKHLTLWTKNLLASYLDDNGFRYEFQNSNIWSKNLRVKAFIGEK